MGFRFVNYKMNAYICGLQIANNIKTIFDDMSNKLQELTERLYSEGLSKGKEEGARILEEAGKQADEIVAKAKAEAEAIKAEAEKQAADLQSKVRSDLKMAAEQCLQATRKDIENILTGCICNEGVDKALGDTDFLKQIISAVAEKFSATESVDIALVMPEKLRKELEPWAKKELASKIGKGIEAEFSKKIEGGFTIGPKDGSYFVSLTEDTFRKLISEYLRPVTKKILFG